VHDLPSTYTATALSNCYNIDDASPFIPRGVFEYVKDYFAFIDESGNNNQDPFFGIGMLLIDDVGALYDAIRPFYDRAFSIAVSRRHDKINQCLADGSYTDLANIARSNQIFELKYKRINSSNNHIYRDLISTYFSFANARFSAIIIDRSGPNFKPDDVFANSWHMYISYAAMLIAGNIKDLDIRSICILADDISKPKAITETFEDSLKGRIALRVEDSKVSKAVINVARIESHSSILLQLVDILLGCVMYDFMKQRNLVGTKRAQRREPAIQEIRRALGRASLADHFTVNQPSYFNVWQVKWGD